MYASNTADYILSHLKVARRHFMLNHIRWLRKGLYIKDMEGSEPWLCRNFSFQQKKHPKPGKRSTIIDYLCNNKATLLYLPQSLVVLILTSDFYNSGLPASRFHHYWSWPFGRRFSKAAITTAQAAKQFFMMKTNWRQFVKQVERPELALRLRAHVRVLRFRSKNDRS